MSCNRRSSAPGLKFTGRRRSSATYVVAAGRRCSLSTYTTTSRVRSNSKGLLGFVEDDIDFCNPPLDEMPKIAGYEDVTFEPCAALSPALQIATEVSTEDQKDTYIKSTKNETLSENDLRKILIRHAESKCANDKRAAAEMKVTKINYQPGYKYRLETFTESRQVSWNSEPYTAPSPWEIERPRPQLFQASSLTIDVPHTDVLMTCPSCGGVGSKRCSACATLGWERCSFCFGDGQKISLQGQKDRCFRCLGTGRKKCWKCNGDTIAVCRGCGGTGQIRCFIAITITWNNYSDVHIIDSPDAEVIEEKLEYADGYIIFQEEKPMVTPVMIPESDLHTVSSLLIEKHQNLLPNEKIISQRHTIYTIPVYCATYEWNGNPGRFFVYGIKKKVFAPDYPQKICCCIIS
ncbi:protein SSUH2 homolog isoform X3 [Uloborus diversus]|uniref:protein SSUH2 homolog isoform X3 n=1 Tax=Uloborus diversus TaxID=327109 RepID=UPI0024091802|nr:protein SSUH2 homolog isoform X3 [Uloborus diversus]